MAGKMPTPLFNLDKARVSWGHVDGKVSTVFERDL